MTRPLLSSHKDTEPLRRSVLGAFGAEGADLEELLAYNANVFDHSGLNAPPSFPLADEPFVAAWQRYAVLAGVRDAVTVLRQPIVQLCFPIRSGISKEPGYRAVVRRGEPADQCPSATGLGFSGPEQVRVILQETAAGRIGVISLGQRDDFENVIRAVTRRNEPESVPSSMGAMMVSGYNNWDRIHEYRRAWRKAYGGDEHDDAWEEEFQRLIPQRDRYQDRFIIASEGPYSGVDASLLDLSPEQWTPISLSIRIEHECTHYFTKRLLGVMRNNLLDEIIADFMGMLAAVERFYADWFACFMGLGGSGRTTGEGRIGIYRGTPPLSDAAFAILHLLVRAAAAHLEEFDVRHNGQWRSLSDRGRLIVALTRMTLEELASDEAVDRLEFYLAMLAAG